jgi:hypothetical protein
MASGRDEREPRRVPPGGPGDDLRSDPIPRSRTSRPYFHSQWTLGALRPAWAWSALAVLAVAAFLSVYALA